MMLKFVGNVLKRVLPAFGTALVFGGCLCLDSCSGGIGSTGREVDKMYSPISVYFNPLQNSDYDQYSSYFPYFVNYPDDWAKMGLHNRPVSVKYVGYDHWTNTESFLGYYFNIDGNISKILAGMWGSDEFIYDESGNLARVKRAKNIPNWDGKRDDEFWYEGDMLVKRMLSPTHHTSHSFHYYPDGVLKEIVPDRGVYYYDKMQLGLLEFNENGQLVRTEAAMTFNPFMVEAKNSHNVLPSVCTFKYDSRGLCVEKNEKIAFKNDGSPVDTISCISRYGYNSRGDMVSWEYEGGCYMPKNGNVWTIIDHRFVINYGYEYDEKGNWITMTVTMPDCFLDIPALKKYYLIKARGYYTDNERVTVSGKPIVTNRRVFGDYYRYSSSELKQMVIDEEKKADLRFTAVQSYGLQGKVKTFETDEKIVSFDKLGNVSKVEYKYSDGNITTDYIYESPLRYGFGEDSPVTMYVEFSDNERKETDRKDDGMDFIYTFDRDGRLVKYQYYVGMAPAMQEYTYSGNERNPSIMISDGFDEMGSWRTTSRYTYLEIDRKGNWLKRKVVSNTESEAYSEEWSTDETTSASENNTYIETRKISYY